MEERCGWDRGDRNQRVVAEGCGEVQRDASGCGGVWRDVEGCGGVWRDVDGEGRATHVMSASFVHRGVQ